MAWVIYTRGTITVHRIYLMQALLEEGDRLNVAKCPDILYINRGPKLWWGWNEKQLLELGDAILSVCATKEGSERHLRGMERAAQRAIKGADGIKAIDLEKVSNERLGSLYDELYTECKDAHGWLNIDIDVIDIVLGDFLKKEIRKNLPKNISAAELERVYEVLLKPACLTYVNQEALATLKSALRKDHVRAARELHKKFYWTNLGWENMVPHSEEYFLGRINEVSQKGHILESIKDIEDRVERILNERDSMIQKYSLSRNVRHWLEVMDRYTVLHDIRKEVQVKTVYEFHRIMLEAARRLRLDPDDLEWLTYHEVRDLHKGKTLDKIEVERRKKSVAIVVREGKMEFLSGDAADEVFRKEIPQEKFEQREFRGISANKGHVTGVAKVCNGRDDALRKIQIGDILVCGMTLPDYVPAMKKAAAIVTDEGGITCHAAIVSRELGKPCIIGTKIATQVLRDGMTVEVDAEKGIVKILKS